MALCGQKTAFTACGISCQANYQLTINNSFLSEVFNENFDKCTSIFDWILIDINHVSPFIDRIMKGNIFTLDSLTTNLTSADCFTIEDFRAYLWHENKCDASQDEKISLCNKLNHIASNFQKIFKYENAYFIFSNCQNNLTAVEPYIENKYSIEANTDVLTEIHDTLAKYKKDIHFISVLSQQRFLGPTPPGLPLVNHDQLNWPDWTGNPEVWKNVFGNIADYQFQPPKSLSLGKKIKNFLLKNFI